MEKINNENINIISNAISLMIDPTKEIKYTKDIEYKNLKFAGEVLLRSDLEAFRQDLEMVASDLKGAIKEVYGK